MRRFSKQEFSIRRSPTIYLRVFSNARCIEALMCKYLNCHLIGLSWHKSAKLSIMCWSTSCEVLLRINPVSIAELIWKILFLANDNRMWSKHVLPKRLIAFITERNIDKERRIAMNPWRLRSGFNFSHRKPFNPRYLALPRCFKASCHDGLFVWRYVVKILTFVLEALWDDEIMLFISLNSCMYGVTSLCGAPTFSRATRNVLLEELTVES